MMNTHENTPHRKPIKRRFVIITTCILICILFIVGYVNSIHVADKTLFVKEIYFNNAQGLQCSKNNPYREQLLNEIEALSKQKQRTATEFEHEPEITIQTANGLTLDFSLGVTHYEYPDVEGEEYENRDESSYYIRISKKDKLIDIFYYEWHEAATLRQIMYKAIYYEYVNLETFTGVVTGIYDYHNKDDLKLCYIKTIDYGTIQTETMNIDNIVVGDVVDAVIHNIDRSELSADCRVTLRKSD